MFLEGRLNIPSPILLKARLPAEMQDIELLPVTYEMAIKGIAKGNPALSTTKLCSSSAPKKLCLLIQYESIMQYY